MIPGLSTLYPHPPGLPTQPAPVISQRSLEVRSGITTPEIGQISNGPTKSLVANNMSPVTSITQPVFGAPSSLSRLTAINLQDKATQSTSQDDKSRTPVIVQRSLSPEAMSIDGKEEGEVSEGPDAPKSPGNSVGTDDQDVNEDFAQMLQEVSLPTQTYGGSGTSQLAAQRENAKTFILEWQRNGYTFAQLAGEGLDAGFLRSLYHELHLKLDDSSSASKPVSETLSKSVSVPVVDASLPETLPTDRNRSVTVDEAARSPLSQTNGISVSREVLATSAGIITNSKEQPKAAPENRKEYIARLLAAKTKRSTVASNSASPLAAPAHISTAAIDLTVGDGPTSAIDLTLDSQNNSPALATVVLGTTNADVSAVKRKAQTELARLRLQALSSSKASGGLQANANGAPAIEVISLPASVTNSPAQPAPAELPQGKLVTVPADLQVAVSAPTENLKAVASVHPLSTVQIPATRPTSTVSNHFVASIPIRGSSPRSASSDPDNIEDGRNVTSASPRPSSAAKLRKRPLAVDFDEGPPSKMSRRPFGDVPGVVDYEDMVIEISDDESMDDIPASAHVLRSLPQAVRTEVHVNSSRNTPTVASTSEVDRLRLQEEQIMEMKRMIADREMKRKAKLAIASRPTTPGPAAMEVQATTPSVCLAKPDAVADEDVGMADTVADEDMDMSDVPTKSLQHLGLDGANDEVPAFRHVLTRSPTPHASSATAARTPTRQDELQTQLPALEASVNSSQAKMALLQAQMDALRDEMQKLAEKDSITQEPQQPGVNVNGMSRTEVPNVQEALREDQTPAIVAHNAAAELENTEPPPKKAKRTKEEKEARRREKADRLAADEEGIALGVDVVTKPSVDAPDMTKAQRRAQRKRDKAAAARTKEAFADSSVEAKATESRPERVINRNSMPFEGFSGSEEGEIVTPMLPADTALSADEVMENLDSVAVSNAKLVDAAEQPELTSKQKANEKARTLLQQDPNSAGMTKKERKRRLKVLKVAAMLAEVADAEAVDQDQNKPTTHLRFWNLHCVNLEQLKGLLAKYKTLAIDMADGACANVEMSNVKEAQRCSRELQGRLFRKHPITIRYMASSSHHARTKRGSGIAPQERGVNIPSFDGAQDDRNPLHRNDQHKQQGFLPVSLLPQSNSVPADQSIDLVPADDSAMDIDSEPEYEPSDYEPSEYEPSDIVPSSMTTRQTVEHAPDHVVNTSVNDVATDHVKTDSPLLDQDTTEVAQVCPPLTCLNDLTVL